MTVYLAMKSMKRVSSEQFFSTVQDEILQGRFKSVSVLRDVLLEIATQQISKTTVAGDDLIKTLSSNDVLGEEQ